MIDNDEKIKVDHKIIDHSSENGMIMMDYDV